MAQDQGSDPQARLDAFKSVVVAHPRLLDVDRQVTQAIQEKAGYAHILVFGPSGVGKTIMTQRIVERFLAEAPTATVPVVYVEARTPDNGEFSRGDFYRQVLMSLGEHVLVRNILVNVANGASQTNRRSGANDLSLMRDGMEEALRKLHVRALIIDEAQHLMKTDKLLDQLDWLKSLTNMTQTLHVLVGNYDLLDFRNLSGQSARRGHDIHFSRYQFEQVQDRTDFQGVFLFLLERLPLTIDIADLMQHWPYVYERCIGCVGILKDWLIVVAAATLAKGETTLTFQALESHAFTSAKCLRMGLEARDGERTAADNPQDIDQLHQLLGMTDEGIVPVVTAPTPPKRGARKRAGTRGAKRDAVE